MRGKRVAVPARAVTHPSRRDVDARCVTHVAKAVRAEHHFRQLLHRGGLPQPDEVEYHETEVLFLWHEAKAAVVVELDRISAPSEPRSYGGEG